MAQVRTVTVQVAERLDTLCQREYGGTHGFVEAVLDANPGLANLGFVLPVGTEVILPDVDAQQQSLEVTRLWT